LWRGSEQITRNTPPRRTILQLRQSFFTEVLTFMLLSLLALYFARKVILARVKSYGVISTLTLSPGRMRM
jgi:hypothetical protein